LTAAARVILELLRSQHTILKFLEMSLSIVGGFVRLKSDEREDECRSPNPTMKCHREWIE
jgi:hypothetical protein